MYSAPSTALMLLLLAGLGELGAANNKLRSPSAKSSGFLTAHAVEDTLLGELATALRHRRGGASDARLDALEAALKPTFKALPTNAQGKLGPAAVRYALHRLFVQRHGWFVKGLVQEKASDANSAFPAEILKNKVPGYIQDLFDQRSGTEGLGLLEVAVLAATLEHLVHDETIGRLQAAYEAHNVSPASEVDVAEVDGILDTYMVAYINGVNLTGIDSQEIQTLKRNVQASYRGWKDTKLWAQDVRQSVAYAGRSNPFLSGQMSFADTAHVIETMNDQYGHFQNQECRSLKELLVDYEDRDRGRVRLSEFYRAQLSGSVPPAFQLSESADFLRQMGALDDSDPARPSVIVPNYLTARSNCLASSEFYTVCCIDECEDLLGHLERHLKAPRASAAQIVQLVSELPSDTVEAPRQLSSDLVLKLNEIAAAHGGEVPLHGRLFAQWMHHAYPRECPYPHVETMGDPETTGGWVDESRRTITASEMERHATSNTNEDAAEGEAALPWALHEQLLVPDAPPTKGWGSWLQLVLLASVALSLLSTFKSSWSSLYKGTKKKVTGLPWQTATERLDKYA